MNERNKHLVNEDSIDLLNQLLMYDPEDRRTYYETDTEYRTQTMTFDFDELDESDRIIPGRDPDYGKPVKLKYISDTWNMINKYGIEDWEDHDSYISVIEAFMNFFISVSPSIE